MPTYAELYILLKTLAFPLPSGFVLWNRIFTVGGRKSANSRFFSFALGALAYFALFFLRAFALFFWLRARERESAKKAPAPTSAHSTAWLEAGDGTTGAGFSFSSEKYVMPTGSLLL